MADCVVTQSLPECRAKWFTERLIQSLPARAVGSVVVGMAD